MTIPKSDNVTVVVLSGGLGNQLFQFAAGIHLSRALGTKLVLEESLGSPRRSGSGKVEIHEFQLPQFNKCVQNHRYSTLAKRLYAGLLVSNSRTSNSMRLIRAPLKAFSSVILNKELRSNLTINPSKDIGYSIERSRVNELLVGYFQSYRYIDSQSLNIIREELILFDSDEKIFNEWKTIALVEIPLVVHVRRGDYKNENFGLLSFDYYEKALRALPSDFYKKIWIFSDSNDEAQSLLSEYPAPLLRFIETPKYSSALILKIMSLGEGYILANSTFGYWAAQLSEVLGSRIIAPSPWFRDIVEPRDLIDPEWGRIDAAWEE